MAGATGCEGWVPWAEPEVEVDVEVVEVALGAGAAGTGFSMGMGGISSGGGPSWARMGARPRVAVKTTVASGENDEIFMGGKWDFLVLYLVNLGWHC
jgi:hypothetical protein